MVNLYSFFRYFCHAWRSITARYSAGSQRAGARGVGEGGGGGGGLVSLVSVWTL